MRYPSFESLFRFSPNAYALIAPDLVVCDVNPAWLTLTGRVRSAVVGCPPERMLGCVPVAGRPCALLASLERARVRGTVDTCLLEAGCCAMADPHGQTAWQVCHTPLLDERGELEAILQHLLVVTTRDEQVGARQLETLGRLTTGVVHAFNNLLQVIGGNLQLLRRGPVEPVVGRRLDAAIGAVDQGGRLAARLLAVAGRQPQVPRAVCLDDVIESMQELLECVLGRGVDLLLARRERPWPVCVDTGALEGLILDLVVRGGEALGGQGRLSLSVANRTFTASATGESLVGDYVVFDMAGTGRSERVPLPPAPAGGPGSLAALLVERCGGVIERVPQVAGSVLVRVYLPRHRDFTDAAVAPTAVRSEPAQAALRVLFVEDDPTLRMLTSEVMAELGHQVVASESAEEALQHLASQSFDVLFTDIGLPGMNGLELARRASEHYPALQVVIASGHAIDARAEGLPQIRTVLKPYDLDRVKSLLDEVRVSDGPT